MQSVWDNFTKFVRSDWLAFIGGIVAIVAVTAIVSRLVTRFLRKMLHYNKENNLPSSSIFINIARAAIWIIGFCILLSTCFNVDVSAMIAALGVGGIAVSLGFQNTLANLIAGLQISLMRIVKPGDNIKVATNIGVVRDVNWWNTSIVDSAGNLVLIPNSSIVSSALVHLSPANNGSVALVLTVAGADTERVSRAIEEAAAKAAELVGPVVKAPSLTYSAITDDGLQGSLAFTMERASDVSGATDAIIRAISPLVHAQNADQALRALDGELADVAHELAAHKAGADAGAVEAAAGNLPAAAAPGGFGGVGPAGANAKPSHAAPAGSTAHTPPPPLLGAHPSPEDAAAATVSTLEGAILGEKPARRRLHAVVRRWKERHARGGSGKGGAKTTGKIEPSGKAESVGQAKATSKAKSSAQAKTAGEEAGKASAKGAERGKSSSAPSATGMPATSGETSAPDANPNPKSTSDVNGSPSNVNDS